MASLILVTSSFSSLIFSLTYSSIFSIARSTAAKKRSSKKPKKAAAASHLSPELAEICGATELPRTEVVKKTWDYIKKHKLQDPKNKRMIKPDKKLAKVFGGDKAVDMMKLAGILGGHLKSS